MTPRIETPAIFDEVGKRIRTLVGDGDAAAALSLADDLEGEEIYVTQLRAFTFTEAGAVLADRPLIEKGSELWRSLEGRTPDWRYNLGNAELNLFEFAEKADGRAIAFQNKRHHLTEARSCFFEVAHETSRLDKTRLQAFTNLGNSYSQTGRELEAMEHWQGAFAIDPDFAMAHANRGLALKQVAPFVGVHAPAVLDEAALELDTGLSRPEDLLWYGGPAALERFKKTREALPTSPSPLGADDAPWGNDYLQWCRTHELFLHVSHRCLREDTSVLDPLFFSRLTVEPERAEHGRTIPRLLDAFNSLKQGYVTARYLTWLGTDPTGSRHAGIDSIEGRIRFVDTKLGARFDLRTGIALQSFTAATNLLDQVAAFVHQYFDTGRNARSIFFREFWQASNGHFEPKLEEWLQADRFNRGLYALCDLAADLERESPLARHVGRRHAVTHRFLVAHDDLAEPDPDKRLERVGWEVFIDGSIQQLRLGRAALIYVTRTVVAAEAFKRQSHP